MLANEKPIQCAECYKNEELFGGRSHRTQQNALFLTDNIENLAEQENASGFPKIAREQLQETTSPGASIYVSIISAISSA